jgi:hypothetical protein
VFAKVRHGGRRVESPDNDAKSYFRYCQQVAVMAGVIGSEV